MSPAVSITGIELPGTWRALLLVILLGIGPTAAAHDNLPLNELDEIAPDMELAPGKMLSDLRGNWVLLHFWATWCEPCVDELPALERFHGRSGDALMIVTIAMDGNDAASVHEFRERHGLRLPVFIEQDVRGHRPYTGWGLPATYFIAPDGRLAARALGVRNWNDIEAGPLIDRLETR